MYKLRSKGSSNVSAKLFAVLYDLVFVKWYITRYRATAGVRKARETSSKNLSMKRLESRLEEWMAKKQAAMNIRMQWISLLVDIDWRNNWKCMLCNPAVSINLLPSTVNCRKNEIKCAVRNVFCFSTVPSWFKWKLKSCALLPAPIFTHSS